MKYKKHIKLLFFFLCVNVVKLTDNICPYTTCQDKSEMFVNLLLLSTSSSFNFFTQKDLNKIAILVSSDVIPTCATHAIHFKTLP